MGRRILLVLALLLLPALAHAQIHLVNPRTGAQPPQHANGFTPASIARMDKGLLQGYLDAGYRFVVQDPSFQKHIPQWALDYQNALDRPRGAPRPVEQPRVPTPQELVTRELLPHLQNENPDRLLTGSEMKMLSDAGYVTVGRDGVHWTKVPNKDGKIEKRVFVRKDGLVGYTQLQSPDLWEDEVAPLEKEGRFRDVS